ncbi:MAG: hypothetical protein KJ065_23805 [Anaerolineae bacterium]|nr:hypothetical protein [Anaerolineae bacterium]
MMSQTEYQVTYKYMLVEKRMQAERRRLVREALTAHRGKVRVVAPLLAKLGSRLVTLGSDLQQRYGEAQWTRPASKPSLNGIS